MIKHSFVYGAVVIALGVTAARAEGQAPAGAPIDVCKLVTAAEAGETLGGAVAAPTADAPKGSLLGGCTYMSTASGRLMMLNARPAREFDSSVKTYTDLKPVEGVGAGVKAFYSSKVGMLMSQPGKPYFIHILMVGGGDAKTEAAFAAVAKKIVAKG